MNREQYGDNQHNQIINCYNVYDVEDFEDAEEEKDEEIRYDVNEREEQTPSQNFNFEESNDDHSNVELNGNRPE